MIYHEITAGKKTIKASGGLHKITFSVEQYDNLLVGRVCLTEMPECSVESNQHLTGENRFQIIDDAKSMLYYMECDIERVIEELMEFAT